jgi:hypothetical protein
LQWYIRNGVDLPVENKWFNFGFLWRIIYLLVPPRGPGPEDAMEWALYGSQTLAGPEFWLKKSSTAKGQRK